MTIPVVAIVGLSNSGKTTVAVALIRILTERGYSIAAVKHSPHGHQIDRPDTDSARLFAAGASRVMLSSPGQVTSIQRTNSDTPLEEIVASLEPGYHLVIAEGFKNSTLPKVMVLSDVPISPPPHNVIAVVGTGKVCADIPHYALQQLEELADQIQGQLLAPKTPSLP